MKHFFLAFGFFLLCQPISAQKVYDLFGPDEKVYGISRLNEMQFKAAEGSILIKVEGQKFYGNVDRFFGKITTKVTYPDANTCQKQYLEETFEMGQTIAGESSMEIDTGVLVGHTITYNRNGEDWFYKKDARYTAEMQEELKEEAISLYSETGEWAYPKAVKVGETWTLSGKQIVGMLGLADGDIRGTAVFELVDVQMTTGDIIATVKTTLKARGLMIQDGITSTTEFNLNFETKRSLTTFTDLHTEGNGKMKIYAPLSEGGQEMTMLIDMDVLFKGRQRIVR